MFKKICKLICDTERVPLEQVMLHTRKREIVYTRQLIQFFCVEFDLGTEEVIASWFGQDRCTIFNSVKAIQDYYDTDKVKRVHIDQYRKQLVNMKKELVGQGAGITLSFFSVERQRRGVRMALIM